MSLANLFPKYKCPKCDDWFHMPFKYCGCNRDEYTLKLTHEEIDNLLNGLSFFQSNYPKNGSVETRRDMKKLEKKLWKVLRSK